MLQNVFTLNANKEIASAATMSMLADMGIGVFVAFSSLSTVQQKRTSVAWPRIATTNDTK